MVKTCKMLKSLFKNNKEELELLKYFHKIILINKLPSPRRCRPVPRAPIPYVTSIK